MALDLLNGKIRVYNYGFSSVGFPSQHNEQGVFVRGRENEDEEYVVERVAFDDIEIENSKSDIFRVGLLRFNPDEEDEVYKKLGIEDRSNIKTDKELIELLKDDSIENIKMISNIKSQTLLNRMKRLLFSMERNNNIPPHNISAVVLERSNELKYGGKRNQKSEINLILENDRKAKEEGKTKEMLQKLSEKVEQLEKESAEKDKTINESQTAIQQLLDEVKSLTGKEDEVKEKTTNRSTAKKTATKTTTTKKTSNTKKE